MVITAEYECENCGEIELEHKHSVTKKTCPTCKGKLQRLISSPIISKMGDPRTIGSLAERNSKKNPLSAKKGLTERDYKKIKTRKKVDKLNNMTPEQQARYIETGNE